MGPWEHSKRWSPKHSIEERHVHKGEEGKEKFQAIDASLQQTLDQTKKRLENRFKPTTTGTRRVSKGIQTSMVVNAARMKKMFILMLIQYSL